MAVFSVASLRSRERAGELQLLKLLGMNPGALFASVTGELAVIASSAALVGLALATGLASALSVFLFDSPAMLPGPGLAVGVVGAFLAAGTLLGALASRSSVNAPPQRWLKQISQ
jgi:ABC-type antimicrobial peptide transport system permease subunit